MNKFFTSLAALIGVLVLIAALIVAVPLLVIWSLNTLFPVLAIEYTFWTWAAALVLMACLQAKNTVKKDK